MKLLRTQSNTQQRNRTRCFGEPNIIHYNTLYLTRHSCCGKLFSAISNTQLGGRYHPTLTDSQYLNVAAITLSINIMNMAHSETPSIIPDRGKMPEKIFFTQDETWLTDSVISTHARLTASKNTVNLALPRQGRMAPAAAAAEVAGCSIAVVWRSVAVAVRGTRFHGQREAITCRHVSGLTKMNSPVERLTIRDIFLSFLLWELQRLYSADNSAQRDEFA